MHRGKRSCAGIWATRVLLALDIYGMVLHAENKTTNYAMDFHGGLMNLLASEFSTA